jgi:hypothetical protein
MWPIQLAFLRFVVCRLFLSSFALCNTSSFFTRTVQMIFVIVFQHQISKLPHKCSISLVQCNVRTYRPSCYDTRNIWKQIFGRNIWTETRQHVLYSDWDKEAVSTISRPHLTQSFLTCQKRYPVINFSPVYGNRSPITALRQFLPCAESNDASPCSPVLFIYNPF